MRMTDADSDSRLQEALLEYVARSERGERIDAAAFVAERAAIAAELSAALEGLQLLTEAGRQLAPVDVSGRLTNPRLPLGDYHLLEELGRGGMGVVYAAEQRSLGRRVAIKLLPAISTLDARLRQRFLNEARAAALIAHPHVVPVYAVDCAEGVHYFVMQLIDGCSLGRVIAALRRRDDATDEKARRLAELAGAGDAFFRTAANWIAQAADALAAAHDLGIVHRDVKPANLLVDLGGKLWVTDFGLARVHGDHELTMTGHAVGTARYMSPEQSRGGDGVDARTDVYSLGATLYELLTLTPAFPANEQLMLRRQLADAEPTRPRRINSAVPRDLETIVVTAMAPSPVDRYATAGAFAADLRRFLDGRPVLARRPNWFDYFRRWLWRRRRGVGTLCAAVVLGVACTFAWSQHQIKQALARAEAERDLARVALLDTIDLARELSSVSRQQKRVRQFLQMAKVHLETMERSASDAESRFVLARALYEVARVRNGLGETAVADQLLRRSTAILDQLMAESPGEQRYRRELADCYRVHSCILGEGGQYAEAARQTGEALRIYKELSAADPTSGELLGLLADRHSDHSRALRATGDVDGSDRESAAALSLYRLLVGRYEKDPQARSRLAGALTWRGHLEMEAGRAAVAGECFREASAQDEWMEKNFGNRPDNRIFTLDGVASLGRWLDEHGQPDEAEVMLRRVVAGCRRIVEYSPDVVGNVEHAANAHNDLAAYLQRRGRGDEAIRECRAAIGLLESVAASADSPPRARWCLALLLAAPETPALLRDPARARTLAEAVTREMPQWAVAWITLASVCRAAGDLPAARAALDHALAAELKPDGRLECLFQAAELELQRGNRDEAAQLLRQAIASAEGNPWLRPKLDRRRDDLAKRFPGP